jgi:thiol-disulfide isomerase/thioredoxin
MEKWKIAVIAALLLSLIGFGIYQDNPPSAGSPVPSGTPKPLSYLGKTLPPWNFKTWSGQPVPLASLLGKPALIEIFRIECPHCQDAAPFMVEMVKRYGPRGLKFVAIQSPGDFKDLSNPENSWGNVQTWMKKFGINYPVAFDEKSNYFQGTLKKQLLNNDANQLLYPTILMLDKTGHISMAHTGFQPTKPDSMSNIIDMAVALEKAYPGKGSAQENAKSLVDWLRHQLPDLQVDGPLVKAMIDDIAQRLKK